MASKSNIIVLFFLIIIKSISNKLDLEFEKVSTISTVIAIATNGRYTYALFSSDLLYSYPYGTNNNFSQIQIPYTFLKYIACKENGDIYLVYLDSPNHILRKYVQGSNDSSLAANWENIDLPIAANCSPVPCSVSSTISGISVGYGTRGKLWIIMSSKLYLYVNISANSIWKEIDFQTLVGSSYNPGGISADNEGNVMVLAHTITAASTPQKNYKFFKCLVDLTCSEYSAITVIGEDTQDFDKSSLTKPNSNGLLSWYTSHISSATPNLYEMGSQGSCNSRQDSCKYTLNNAIRVSAGIYHLPFLIADTTDVYLSRCANNKYWDQASQTCVDSCGTNTIPDESRAKQCLMCKFVDKYLFNGKCLTLNSCQDVGTTEVDTDINLCTCAASAGYFVPSLFSTIKIPKNELPTTETCYDCNSLNLILKPAPSPALFGAPSPSCETCEKMNSNTAYFDEVSRTCVSKENCPQDTYTSEKTR